LWSGANEIIAVEGGWIMSVEVVRGVLLWSGLMNYAMLLLWVMLLLFAHDWLYRLNSKFIRLSVEQFDLMNYGGVGLYKVGIFLFNLMPCLALWIVA
jgi:hypothetical protein